MEGHALTDHFAASPGYIYGVTHPSFPGYVKIGKASRPRKRLQQYNTGCPNRSYELAFTLLVADQHLAERVAQRRLAGSRVKGTEWFAIHPQDAFNLLSNLSESADNDDA